MEKLRSLDLDGLDGIIQSSDKPQFTALGHKAIWVMSVVGLAVAVPFLLQKSPYSPAISPVASVQTTDNITVAQSSNVEELKPKLADSSSVSEEPQASEQTSNTITVAQSGNVKEVKPKSTDNSSISKGSEVLARSDSAQVPQELAALTPEAQSLPAELILPTEPTAAGIPDKPMAQTPFTARFKLNSSKPVPLSKAETSRLIELAMSCPTRIRIIGHTCNLGGDAVNRRLGMARANALKKTTYC